MRKFWREVTRKVQETCEPRIHLRQGFGVTCCPGVTDRLFDRRKRSECLPQSGQIGALFVRCLLLEEKPGSARREVAPGHSLLNDVLDPCYPRDRTLPFAIAQHERLPYNFQRDRRDSPLAGIGKRQIQIVIG